SRVAPSGLDRNPPPPLVPAFDRLDPPQPAGHSQRREVVKFGQVHPVIVAAARAVDAAWAAWRPTTAHKPSSSRPWAVRYWVGLLNNHGLVNNHTGTTTTRKW